MKGMRTHTCGELRKESSGATVTLCGWVHRRRDHGGVIFVDLRDRYGITQVTFDPAFSENSPSYEFAVAETIRNEFVIRVTGLVKPRPTGMVNENLPTGAIEVFVRSLEILSASKPMPFLIEDETTAGESLRLKYRYLDLRRPSLRKSLEIRSNVMQIARKFLTDAPQSFLEIETPILYKTTPEGARDYLVPSRVHPGQFYALPQSPQTLKQILMIAGMDRYFQIARCFRDEDLRFDRQPEFSQIDIEVSFPEINDFLSTMESLVSTIWENADPETKVSVQVPFPRISYDEAMMKYGSDRPDTRFELTHVNLTSLFQKTEFKAFALVAKGGGLVKGMRIPGGSSQFSRKDLDDLAKVASTYGAKGMAWLKYLGKEEFQGPIAKFFSEEEKKGIIQEANLSEGDLIVFVADKPKVAHEALGHVRLEMGRRLGLMDPNQLNFLWVTDFPLFEYDEVEGRYYAAHHPFTSPRDTKEDREFFFSKEKKDWASVKASAYDCVLNGNEIGGGSFRIFDSRMQAQMFRILGISDEEAKTKFGFFLEALEYGTPPHGGIAFGLDRMIMLIQKTEAIRDVIAFPKTQKATDLMSETPSEVSHEQLFELSIQVRSPD